MTQTNQIQKILEEMNLLVGSLNDSPSYEDLKKSNSQKDRQIVERLDKKWNNLMKKLSDIATNPYQERHLSGFEPYFDQLILSRKILQNEVWGFPRNSCEIAAKVVSQVIGLEEVAGDCKYDPTSYHSWNFDPERGLFLCISMDQYKENDSDVTWLPATTDILTVLEIPTKNQWLYNLADIKKYVNKIKSITRK